MGVKINGRMKVKTLREQFKKEFGLTLRMYDGRSFADDDATIAKIRKGTNKGGDFEPRRNTKVGNLEDKMMEMFGVKVQVAGSQDDYLCNNDLTLATALAADEKRVAKKAKRADNAKSGEASDEEQIAIVDIPGAVRFILSKSGVDEESVDDIETDICKLSALIAKNSEDIEDHFSENESDSDYIVEELENVFESISLNVENIWQYAVFAESLNRSGIETEIPEEIRSKCSAFADSWTEAISMMKSGLEEKNTDAPTEADFVPISNYIIGCLFVGVELAVIDEDEEGIDAWILGFGNPVQFDEPIGELLLELEWNLRDEVIGTYIDLLKLYFEIDINDFRDDHEVVEWEELVEELKANVM